MKVLGLLTGRYESALELLVLFLEFLDLVKAGFMSIHTLKQLLFKLIDLLFEQPNNFPLLQQFLNLPIPLLDLPFPPLNLPNQLIDLPPHAFNNLPLIFLTNDKHFLHFLFFSFCELAVGLLGFFITA